MNFPGLLNIDQRFVFLIVFPMDWHSIFDHVESEGVSIDPHKLETFTITETYPSGEMGIFCGFYTVNSASK